MLQLITRLARWKLGLFGLKAEIQPMANALTLMRLWSVVMTLIFGGLVYVFTYVLVLTPMLVG